MAKIGSDAPSSPEVKPAYRIEDLLGEKGPSAQKSPPEEPPEEEPSPHTSHPKPKKEIPGISISSVGPGDILVPQPEALAPYAYKSEVLRKILLTVPGFVSDFSQSFLNTESPDLFNVWAGLFAISVLGARNARFKWAVGEMIPNLYVLFVADPARCHKGAAMGRAARLLQTLPGRLLNDGAAWLSQEKDIEMISSKATPDGILVPMLPKHSMFLLPGGQIHNENFGSRAFVWGEEFATFLNARKYNTGLVDTLTYYYDCPIRDKQFTQARGRETFENIFLCVAGALTPSHLQRSMPEEIYSGGFMSRVVLVHVDVPERVIAIPDPDKTPITETELLSRLEYLAWTARGEYNFTPEARDWYIAWYTDYKARCLEREAGITDFSQSRFEHLLIRLATLFRMSEYRPGNDVTLGDIISAKDLLEYTLKGDAAIQYAVSGSANSDELQHLALIRKYLKTHIQVERGKLIRKCSKSAISSNEVNAVLHQLHEEGRIEYWYNGAQSARSEPSVDQREMYKWVDISEEQDE